VLMHATSSFEVGYFQLDLVLDFKHIESWLKKSRIAVFKDDRKVIVHNSSHLGLGLRDLCRLRYALGG
jgi:hypothetical protein